jgi:hypothetical protein
VVEVVVDSGPVPTPWVVAVVDRDTLPDGDLFY